MISIILVALSAMALSEAAVNVDRTRLCWSDGNGIRDGKWWQEGESIVRGRYWYECRAGNLRPQGCITSDERKVRLGEGYEDGGFYFKCATDSKNYLYFEPAACIGHDGRRYEPGETWNHPNYQYWFECEREMLYDRPHLVVKSKGCIVDNRRFAVGATLEKDNQWWECQDRWNSTALCLKGCVVNGQRKSIGESWQEPDYVYECVKRGNEAVPQCVGCVHLDRRLRAGDRYFQRDSVVQCDVLYNPITDKTTQRHRVVGCVERDRRGEIVRERVIGCQWYNKEGDCKYEQICTKEGEPENVGCTIQKGGFDFLFVPADCYTIYHSERTGYKEGRAYACRTQPNGQLKYDDFSPEDVQVKTQGLKYSVPRG